MTPGCSNREKQNDISFHRLPINDSTTLQKWLNNMKLKKRPNLKYSRLCSKHFTEDCYERDLKSELLGIKKQVKLKRDAVPTLFDFSSYDMLTGKKFKTKQNNPKMSGTSKARQMRIEQREQKKFLQKVSSNFQCF